MRTRGSFYLRNLIRGFAVFAYITASQQPLLCAQSAYSGCQSFTHALEELRLFRLVTQGEMMMLFRRGPEEQTDSSEPHHCISCVLCGRVSSNRG